MRVGTVVQWLQEDANYEPVAAYDRFACRWHDAVGDDRDRFRLGFGPACEPLDTALAWAAQHCRKTLVYGLGGVWAVGRRDRAHAPLPTDAASTAAAARSWENASTSRWAVAVRMNLGIRDYADAAPGFADRLAELADVVEAHDDPTGARLAARIIVRAPTERLAGDLAEHLLRQAAAGTPGGLRDEQGNALGAGAGDIVAL